MCERGCVSVCRVCVHVFTRGCVRARIYVCMFARVWASQATVKMSTGRGTGPVVSGSVADSASTPTAASGSKQPSSSQVPPPSSVIASPPRPVAPPAGRAAVPAAVAGAAPSSATVPASAATSKMRGGLFHASISDPAGIARRRAVLQSVFDTIDTNKNGKVDREELAVYARWASSADTSDPLHKRICALFLEGGSLERSFDR